MSQAADQKLSSGEEKHGNDASVDQKLASGDVKRGDDDDDEEVDDNASAGPQFQWRLYDHPNTITLDNGLPVGNTFWKEVEVPCKGRVTVWCDLSREYDAPVRGLRIEADVEGGVSRRKLFRALYNLYQTPVTPRQFVELKRGEMPDEAALGALIAMRRPLRVEFLGDGVFYEGVRRKRDLKKQFVLVLGS